MKLPGFVKSYIELLVSMTDHMKPLGSVINHMKLLGLVNGVLLAVSIISAMTGNTWLPPLIIGCYVFLTVVLLGKQSDLEEQNKQLTEANKELETLYRTCKFLYQPDESSLTMRAHDETCK